MISLGVDYHLEMAPAPVCVGEGRRLPFYISLQRMGNGACGVREGSEMSAIFATLSIEVEMALVLASGGGHGDLLLVDQCAVKRTQNSCR
ncbi:hypothetical protein NDU88_007526 [Pleurodeles waltl]|uniref:Uncharacterized protein n=1 Tax=Pleurodeles waltl TaxID=8319 RepID=A0AAV7SSR6_PLEWA|nr:hypothetical protein NDU88_007526 [Pleurodeles waltl]